MTRSRSKFLATVGTLMMISACSAQGAPSPSDRVDGSTSPRMVVDAATEPMARDSMDAEVEPSPVPVDGGPVPMLHDAQVEVRCGDGYCSPEESCRECDVDCGACPMCTEAPTCSGALAIPAASTEFSECHNDDRAVYSCGVATGTDPADTDCSDPELRIRVRAIRTERGPAALVRHLFCVIDASDGYHSEIQITPRYRITPGVTEIPIPSAAGTFWGQGSLHGSRSNLTINYQCFESRSAERYESLFQGLAEASGAAGTAVSDGGWVFAVASVASSIVASSLSGLEDPLRLAVEQTIDADSFLSMTHGRTWLVESHYETGIEIPHEWRLELQSWGCAETRPVPIK